MGLNAGKIAEIRQPYIDGRFVAGEGAPLAVDNPCTGEIFTDVETASVAQVADAIAAARRSFDDGVWGGIAREDRVAAVAAMADYLVGRRDELAATLIAEAGASVSLLRIAQLDAPLRHIRQACELYLTLPEQEATPRPVDEITAGDRVIASVMVYEPVGVVTAISAYNYPLWTNVWKVFPALLTGNSVILRPSPFTPISALVLGEAADAVGLPPGVLNVIVEGGIEGGQLLTAHPAVDQVTFTGSTTVGQAIMRQAADTVKRLVLELGGKSAQLYLPDAVDRAPGGCAGVFCNHAGQACVAPTRMLVPEDRKAEVVERAAAIAAALRVGDPADPATQVGPLISAAQVERCARYVEAAVAAGATVAAGGGVPASQARGYFFEPTVLDVPDNANPAARDEIFGPVLCVLGYRDLDDAVAIANDSVYGLSAQIYCGDLSLATSIARRIRSGAVNVNGSAAGAYASSGGYKQSGLGRERGVEGIRAFQQMKHLSIAGA